MNPSDAPKSLLQHEATAPSSQIPGSRAQAEAPPGFGPPTPGGSRRPESLSRQFQKARQSGRAGKNVYPIDWLWSTKNRPEYQTCMAKLPAALDRSRAWRSFEMEFDRRIIQRPSSHSRDDDQTPEWFGRDDDLNQEYSFQVLDNEDKAHWLNTGRVKSDVSVLSLRDYEKKERRMNQGLRKDDAFNLVDQPFDSNDILEALRKDREAKQPAGFVGEKVTRDFFGDRAPESRKASRRMDLASSDYRLQNGTDPSTLAYASRTATQLMKQQLSLLGYSFVPSQAQRLKEGGLNQDERDRLLWEESQRKIYIQAIAEASLIQEQRNQAALRKLKRQREKQQHAMIFG